MFIKKAKEGDFLVGNIIAATVFAAVGLLVAFISYVISKKALEKNPQKYAMTTVLRQVLQVGFIVAVYFIGRKTDYDITYLLVGGVLGLTVPMFFFTKKLLNYNEAINKEKRKEPENDG